MRTLATVVLGLSLLGLRPSVTSNEHPAELEAYGCLFHQHREQAKNGLPNPRPAANHSFASATLPLTVHWPDDVEESYAKEILTYAEASWAREFGEMQFIRPHGDGAIGGDDSLDIYITTELDPGIGGYAGFSGFVDETPRQDAFGYLVINNSIDTRIRRFVVAHEMFHLSQMAYDWWEDLSFMESSATWVADHVFDDENIYWRYFPFFNQEPYTTLDYISIRSPYQYGAALFTTFLDERYGQGDGTLIRKVWESSIQDDIDNEPDFLDSIQLHLPSGLSFGQIYSEFGIWRLLTGSRSSYGFFEEGALWDERMDPYFEMNVKVSALPLENTPAQHAVGPYAHAFLRIENDSQFEGTLAGSFTGTDSVFQLTHLALGPSGIRRTPIATVHNAATVNFDLQVVGTDVEHFIIVTNITDGTYDADTSPWTGSDFSYVFSQK